jgi:hypothetical protein
VLATHSEQEKGRGEGVERAAMGGALSKGGTMGRQSGGGGMTGGRRCYVEMRWGGVPRPTSWPA